MRDGISRYVLAETGWDISRDEGFREANVVFSRMSQKLKVCGKAKVVHHEEIEPEDILKLYSGFDISTPSGLLEKVWFDLVLQLCRRGRENLRQMTKSTFAVSRDAAGRRFIYEVEDEADKNHSSSDNNFDTIGEGYLYEVSGHPLCPVTTFELYISKLHPLQEALWQKPRLSVPDSSSAYWYCNVPMGDKALGKMMSEMSGKYGLPKRYTNHCVRVTSLQILDDEQIPGRHIIRVSGHRSEGSIKSHARKLSSSRKRAISNTFSRATGVLAANNASPSKKTTKNNQPAQPKVFSPKNVRSREQQFQVIPVSPLSSLENYFELGNYNIDSSLSSSQTSKFLEAIEEAEANMNLSASMAANGASSLPYTPAVQFTPNFTGCNTVNFPFHYHQH